MSSTIWTRCEGASEIRPLRLKAWRVVESQHQVSTRRLVGSDAEHQVLERMIESVKPPDRTDGRLHYLLFTPFRYPPLRHGSRFGPRTEAGIWYGSEDLPTAFSEVAYYRLVFLEGTAADLGTVETELTAFQIEARTDRGIDLAASPFEAHAAAISSPVRYDDAQSLGTAMREAGVEAFRYVSARDARGGTNIAVFSPAAFGRRQPRGFENWHCTASRERVEVASRSYFGRAVHVYARAEFLVDGGLPAPAV